MDKVKETRKKIRKTFGADHPLLETFDRAVGILSSGKERISMSMISGERYEAKHLLDLSTNFLNFLEMKFILPENGGETELPIKDVKRWLDDRDRIVLHPKTGATIPNMEEVCIWFYPVQE